MGEPLGDSATYRKADGGLVLGGGGSSTPSSTTVSSTELPDWAKGYAKDTLANAVNLTDINKNPYQTYSQPRIAGFSPMQEQAQTAASNMSAGPEAFQQNMSAYMSPYMQNVVDVQKQEAARQSGIMGTQQQAQATQAGAFGGSRDAIMRSERERNLGQQMNQIQAQGSQAAYDSAANQFRQGVTQDVAINQLQNQYGGQQQQLAQQGLSTNYQDFLNQQNYPYKQIGFMSDLVRGLPLGQQSTAQMYQAPPSMMQNVAALGMGAYGAKQLSMYAEGGQVQSYADGGDINSMDDPNAMTAAVAKLSDEQLQQIIQNPSSAAELQAAKLELATRASEKSGLAGAYNMQNQASEAPSMAHGGMVAFAHGGIPRYGIGGDTGENTEGGDGLPAADSKEDMQTVGNKAANDAITPALTTVAQRVANPDAFTPTADPKAAMQSSMATISDLAGPSPYADQKQNMADLVAQSKDALEQGKGLAALSAMGAMLQGPDFMRALGGSGAAFANTYGQALAAKKQSDMSIAQMKISIANGQRAEKLGLAKDAIGSYQAAETLRLNAWKAKQDQDAKTLKALAYADKATQPPKPAAIPKPSDMSLYEQGDPTKRAVFDRFLNLAHPAVAAAGVTQAGATERQGPALSIDIAKMYVGAVDKATKNVDESLFRNPDWVEAGKSANGKNSKGETQAQVRQRAIDTTVDAELAGIQKRLSGDSPVASSIKPSGADGAGGAIQIPANATAEMLKDGQVYVTRKGNAKWNASTNTFVPVAK